MPYGSVREDDMIKYLKHIFDVLMNGTKEPYIMTLSHGGVPAPEGARDPNEERPKQEPDKTPNQWRQPAAHGGQ